MTVNPHQPPPSLFERLIRCVLPLRCLICSEPAQTCDLCDACIAELPINRPACPCCAIPLPVPASACGSCLKKPPPFSGLMAPWRYEGAVARLVPRFKFHRDLAAGRVLAELAAWQLREWQGWTGADCIVPVPLHADRLAERGYNQALELARVLSATSGVPVEHGALRRIRATVAQSALDAKARRRNVRGAFAAAGVSGKTVVLLDDVATTGTTLGEAAASLRRAGAAQVRALALARVP